MDIRRESAIDDVRGQIRRRFNVRPERGMAPGINACQTEQSPIQLLYSSLP